MKAIKIMLIFSMVLTSISPVIAGEKIKLMIPEPISKEAKDRRTGELKTFWSYERVGEEEPAGLVFNEVDLDKFIKQFQEHFEVEQIELWVEGRTESKGITRLFISFGGAGGIKVILNPKISKK